MDHTFGMTLLNFSYACELIDDGTFSRIRDLIVDYTRKVLEIDFDRMFVEGENCSHNVLLPLGSAISGNYQIIDIQAEGGEFLSLAGLAYKKGTPLWVVSDEEEKDLRKCAKTRDLWSETPVLPKYWYRDGGSNGDAIQTSIVIPLEQGGRVYGVQTYETKERLQITVGAKAELQLIAKAMNHVYKAYLDFKNRMKQTREACNHLNDFLQKPLPKLTQPKIFLASSAKADPDVIGVIKDIVENECQDKFRLIYWKDLNQPGNINVHLLELLSQCRFGICYFSEPIESKSEQPEYQDNPNVIFEAGMLHSRSVNNLNFPADWIPIRKKNGSVAPFDFSSERTILVDRTTNGTVDKENLKIILKNRIEELAKLVT